MASPSSGSNTTDACRGARAATCKCDEARRQRLDDNVQLLCSTMSELKSLLLERRSLIKASDGVRALCGRLQDSVELRGLKHGELAVRAAVCGLILLSEADPARAAAAPPLAQLVLDEHDAILAEERVVARRLASRKRLPMRCEVGGYFTPPECQRALRMLRHPTWTVHASLARLVALLDSFPEAAQIGVYLLDGSVTMFPDDLPVPPRLGDVMAMIANEDTARDRALVGGLYAEERDALRVLRGLHTPTESFRALAARARRGMDCGCDRALLETELAIATDYLAQHEPDFPEHALPSPTLLAMLAALQDEDALRWRAACDAEARAAAAAAELLEAEEREAAEQARRADAKRARRARKKGKKSSGGKLAAAAEADTLEAAETASTRADEEAVQEEPGVGQLGGGLDPELECTMCMDAAPQTRLRPCGHAVLCRLCAGRLLLDTVVQCPVCRACVECVLLF